MAPSLLCCIVLLLFLLSNAENYLTVHPANTVVSIGSSIQLNCSINCLSGIVEWKGLDSADNGQYIAPGYSVQTLQNISIPMEGTRFCVGTCPGGRKRYQKSVQLHVYALPKTLLLSNTMKNGVHYLNCFVERVYPLPEISCYKESKILGEPIDKNEIPEVDDLHNVTWSWEISEEDWLPGTLYRCEAQVTLMNDQVLTREGTLTISSEVETTTSAPASSISQITSTPSWKSETPYVTSTISTSQSPYTMQESTATVSQQQTIPGEYTKNATINTVTIQSTRPTATTPTKPIDIVETATAVPAPSISQLIPTPSWKAETPSVTSTISTSQSPHTMQESTATVSQHQTIPGEYTKNATINTVPIQSTRPTETIAPTKPIDIDVLYLTWTIVPAIGLVGSFLLSLQIYRQLNKKGFFEPNHMESPKVKKDAKSQGSLQTVFSFDRSTKEFSVY